MTTRHVRAGWVLPDDGIIDPIAVEIAASGTRRVALTRAERRLAAARILASGGTPYVISKRLRVSGHTALVMAAGNSIQDSAPPSGASGRPAVPRG